jgi:uncharacterized pyridoxamine 5'-phosphate oxidase family protein
MYSSTGVIPIEVNVPRYKDFMIHIINNDEVSLTLPNNDNLKLLITSDLEFRQSVDILITGGDLATENKKLDVFISTVNPIGIATASAVDLTEIETLIISDIDLPVFYNKVTSQPNSAKTWKNFKFDIDFDSNITLTSTNLLEMKLNSNPYLTYNSIKQGDTLNIHNLFVGTSSVFDFSGQYKVDSLGGSTSSYIYLNADSNPDLVAYGSSSSLPFYFHGTSSTLLSNTPYFSLNKGKKISITRISTSNTSLTEKYHIDIEDIK